MSGFIGKSSGMSNRGLRSALLLLELGRDDIIVLPKSAISKTATTSENMLMVNMKDEYDGCDNFGVISECVVIDSLGHLTHGYVKLLRKLITVLEDTGVTIEQDKNLIVGVRFRGQERTSSSEYFKVDYLSEDTMERVNEMFFNSKEKFRASLPSNIKSIDTDEVTRHDIYVKVNDIKEIINEVDYGTLEELEKDINSLVRKYSTSTFNNALTRAIGAMLGE